MKCPKCGFVSFDYLDKCKKCGRDLRTHKQKIGVVAEAPKVSSDSGMRAEQRTERLRDRLGRLRGREKLGPGLPDFDDQVQRKKLDEQIRLEREKALEEAKRLTEEKAQIALEAKRLAEEKEQAEQLRQRAIEEAEYAKRQAEEKARQEVERARKEAEEKARLELEQARREAEERARQAAERAHQEAEQARQEAEERAHQEAERARHEAEERARQEAERARHEAEERARQEAERARLEAEERAREEAELARREAELEKREELVKEKEILDRERRKLESEKDMVARAKREATEALKVSSADIPARPKFTALEGAEEALRVEPETFEELVVAKGGFFRRLLACGIDLGIFFVIGTLLVYFIKQIQGGDQSAAAFVFSIIVYVYVIIVLLLGFYFILFHSFSGQTLGKIVMGLRVVDKEGQPIGMLRSLVRYVSWLFAFMPLGLGLLYSAFDLNKRGWHDYIAGTIVIKAK